MKPSEIDALEAGKPLDALIAEKVMGWEWRDLEAGLRVLIEPSAEHLLKAGVVIEVGRPPYLNDNLPAYSTDISPAWMVAVKTFMTIAPYHDGTYHAANGQVVAYGETAPLAICRAALKAIQVKSV